MRQTAGPLRIALVLIGLVAVLVAAPLLRLPSETAVGIIVIAGAVWWMFASWSRNRQRIEAERAHRANVERLANRD